MKILVILHKDVYNIVAHKVVLEMLKRNYTIDLYSFYLDKIHVHLFENLNLPINHISNLTHEKISEYDFIYSAVAVNISPMLMNTPKYIFGFSTAFLDEPIGIFDFMFTQRDMKIHFQNESYSVEKTNEIKCTPGLPIGNPKFDFVDSKIEVNEKQILFADAGHYPFGLEGKNAVAKMLIDIASYLPDYKIIIKPRWLPNEKNVTHRNSVHVYDCLNKLTNGNLPNNLVCLQKYVDLEKLVRESELFITSGITSTYLDAIAYNKKGLIASGVPAELSLSHNRGHVRRVYEIEKRSGLCVPYNCVLDYLPVGKDYLPSHKEEMGLNYKNASKTMLDTIEYIYENFISKNKYPKNDFHNVQETLTIDEVISFRYKKGLFSLIDGTKSRIEELDFSDIESYIFNLIQDNKIMHNDDYKREIAIVKMRADEVLLSSKNILMDNPMYQSYYLQALYNVDKLQFENIDDYDAKAMFYYLMGRYEIIKQNNPHKALNYFQQYFCDISNNEYEKTLADIEAHILAAHYWSGVCYYELGDYATSREYFVRCEELTDNCHKKAREYLNIIDNMK